MQEFPSSPVPQFPSSPQFTTDINRYNRCQAGNPGCTGIGDASQADVKKERVSNGFPVKALFFVLLSVRDSLQACFSLEARKLGG